MWDAPPQIEDFIPSGYVDSVTPILLRNAIEKVYYIFGGIAPEMYCYYIKSILSEVLLYT